ncbi:LRR receptor-like serine/threonine-protein kinase GSO1 [Balamuthia mandrillaris]
MGRSRSEHNSSSSSSSPSNATTDDVVTLENKSLSQCSSPGKEPGEQQHKTTETTGTTTTPSTTSSATSFFSSSSSASSLYLTNPKPRSIEEEVERRMQICLQRNSSTHLSLEFLSLPSLPPRLFSSSSSASSSSPFSNLSVIYLSNNKLTTIPEELLFLAHSLKELHMQYNLLETLPPSIAGFSRLEKLFLSHNRLTALPAELGHLSSSLTTLSLFSNRLTEVPRELCKLVSLRALFLDHNRFSRLPPQIRQLTALQTLQLQHNRLRSLPEIGCLRELKRLTLDHNQLSWLPASIATLSILNTCTVQKNRFHKATQGQWRTGVPSLLHISSAAVLNYPQLDFENANITTELKRMLIEEQTFCSKCSKVMFGEGYMERVYSRPLKSLLSSESQLAYSFRTTLASTTGEVIVLLRGSFCSLACASSV